MQRVFVFNIKNYPQYFNCVFAGKKAQKIEIDGPICTDPSLSTDIAMEALELGSEFKARPLNIAPRGDHSQHLRGSELTSQMVTMSQMLLETVRIHCALCPGIKRTSDTDVLDVASIKSVRPDMTIPESHLDARWYARYV